MPYKALRFDHVGTLGDLHFQSLSRPRPGYGEVLVEVHAAGINPSDVQNVLGGVSHTTVPRTPGRDFAGVVVEGPPELLDQEVWGTGGELGFTRDGSHAELLLLPREAVRPKPRALSMVEAASVGVPYVKAWLGLVDAAGLMAGDTVVVVGGGGDVGMASVHLAHWMGARVIGLVIAAEYAEGVMAAGADTVIDMSRPDWFDLARAAVGAKGADVVMDCLGGTPFEPRLALLGRRGRLVALTTTNDRRVSFDLLDFFRRELRLFGVNSLIHDARSSADILEHMGAGFESGALKAPSAQAFPLPEAIAAYQACNAGEVRKAVLTIKAP
jgi:NADPH:quinone reductase-like Zn-dependent oxidoreductase